MTGPARPGAPGAADWVPRRPGPGVPAPRPRPAVPPRPVVPARAAPPGPGRQVADGQPPGRRAFLAAGTAALAVGGISAVAGARWPAVQRVRRPGQRPLPAARSSGAAAAARRQPGHQGPLPVHHAERLLLPGRHRADPAPGGPEELAAPHPRHGGARIAVDFAGSSPPAGQGLHRPRLRVEPGGRAVHRERQVAGRQPGQPAATARVRAGADQLLCTSADGFTSGTPITAVLDGRDALLTVGMNGAPLPVARGFPARMVVPGLYGYVSACPMGHRHQGDHVPRPRWPARRAGWSRRRRSRLVPIDVPGGSVQVRPFPVAGWPGTSARASTRCAVRVDRGPWQQARLAAVPGMDAWRQWGLGLGCVLRPRTVEARATDATGYAQTAAQAGPEPNGASGSPASRLSLLATGACPPASERLIADLGWTGWRSAGGQARRTPACARRCPARRGALASLGIVRLAA